MIQVKAVESQATAHQRELMATAGARRAGRREVVVMTDGAPTQRSAAGIPVSGGRAVGRFRAPRIGAWMINFGVRLGGASIRTS